MSQATLAVVIEGDTARIQVNGRATFECSESLKTFCSKVLSKDIANIALEMDNCAGMDSTFMGMLARISLEAKPKGTQILVVNINDDNKKNLCSLGLKNMFTFVDKSLDNGSFEDVDNAEISQKDQRQNIIDAHQTLIDVHEDNRKEFQDIVDFLNLEKELEEGSDNE